MARELVTGATGRLRHLHLSERHERRAGTKFKIVMG
jgi:hypothetical protein